MEGVQFLSAIHIPKNKLTRTIGYQIFKASWFGLWFYEHCFKCFKHVERYPVRLGAEIWCPRPDSNRHSQREGDFKSPASTIPPLGHKEKREPLLREVINPQSFSQVFVIATLTTATMSHDLITRRHLNQSSMTATALLFNKLGPCDWIRTNDLPPLRQTLYPTELSMDVYQCWDVL